jgi:hypothetical protein
MSLADWSLHTPLVQGMIIKALADVLHSVFVQVDATPDVKKAEKYLHPTAVVLAALATAINLALAGKLETVDVTAILSVFVPMILGMKAAPTKTLVDYAQGLKHSVVGLVNARRKS